MGNAGFLLVAVALSILGSLFLWLRARKPKRFTSSIDEFQREMNALGRRPGAESRRRARARRPDEERA